MWYFKVQILIYKDVQDLQNQTNDLQSMCRLFDLELVGSRIYHDAFYIGLPSHPPEACMAINALEGYFYFHNVAHRMAWDDSEGPLIDYIGKIDEISKSGTWHNKTKNT